MRPAGLDADDLWERLQAVQRDEYATSALRGAKDFKERRLPYCF